ncbi:hypothetical protein [Cereibacter johrii]|uniref:Acyltransferase n=1 Tax=Cereibacter johrii TaxID=445629 RepID=A0ABX5JEH2_9RHOB|nr:hypothetical protein [Cereibacter johrii]QCP85697.1 hypothetical protein EYE35_08420 [Cereibacter sphaeroides]RDS96526.1 hypothetical protein DWF04_11170 [Cereibacter sphaeroides f. sp. denitrificans]MEA5162316.1 hypothetical protein [Cereibacter johrii]PTM82027.1 hypothetical protein C8J29_101975 [Cereibacter johrii]RAZ88111.1 hypothetical protein DDV93_02785 [Cereibacter johrii]
MIVLAGALLGAFLGVATARRHGGQRLDMAQYGAAFAIAFALGGLFLTILIERLA